MKKALKSLSMVLTIVLLVSSMSFSTYAVNYKNREHNGFTYFLIGKEITITGYVGNKTKITIPKKIKGYEVVDIDLQGKGASLKGVTRVHIPNKFSIGGGWAYAKDLKKITFNKSNKNYSVKNNLVLNKKGTEIRCCPGGLKKIKMPNSVKVVDGFNSRDITKISFGKNATRVKQYAFASCEKLKTVEFNKKLKKIEYCGFVSCDELTKIRLPRGFKSLGNEAFRNCEDLKKVVIPKTTEYIGQGAFEDCEELEKVYIYSKDCEINPGEYDKYYKKYLSETIPKDATVYGYKNSTAQKYAKKNGNEFVVLK